MLTTAAPVLDTIPRQLQSICTRTVTLASRISQVRLPRCVPSLLLLHHAVQPIPGHFTTLAHTTSTCHHSRTIMSSSEPTASGGPTSQTTSTPTVLSSPHPQVRCFSRPFSRFGILPVGGRSTAIKLQQPPNENAVWVLASTPLDEPVKESLKELGGEVKWIIAADAVHSMFTEEWSKAFPDAKCIGVEGLDAKRPNISWAGIYGKDREGTTYGFEEEIQARYFPTFANKDVAFHHVASRSAIVADLLFNLPAKEQYLGSPSKSPSSPVPFLTGMATKFNPFHGLHQTFLWNAGAAAAIPEACVPEGVTLSTPGGSTEERRARFAKDAEIFAAWGAERVIPCHGDVIEGKGREAWLAACKKFLSPEGKSLFEKTASS